MYNLEKRKSFANYTLILYSLALVIIIVTTAYISTNSCNEPFSYDCNYNKGICEIESYEMTKEFLPNHAYLYFYNISCYNLCKNGYYFDSEYNIDTIKYLNMSAIYYKNGNCQFNLDYVRNNHYLSPLICLIIIISICVIFCIKNVFNIIDEIQNYKYKLSQLPK